MMNVAVPDELMSRFRTVSMERLERIDTAWTAIVHGETSPSEDAQLLRDVHTLKGDAKVVGLVEASMLCQRLEDLLSAARDRSYRVHEDVDIVVTMTIQFIAMLVRKRSAGGGIDLQGFLKQIEEVMSEWLRRSSEAPDRKLSVGPHLRVKDRDRVTESSGIRLSSATTSVYVEHLRATSTETKARLHQMWTELRAGVIEAHRAPLTSIVFGHVRTAREIAEALGKRLTAVVHGDDIAVSPETADALSVVLVHALRNAVDHGIELPAVRQKANKPPIATLKVDIERHGERISLLVEDDGTGVDIDAVRVRAVERGLLSPELARDAPAERVLECLLAPGFSTRDSTSELSGRGIGLDAAHAAVRELGGDLTLESHYGWGTTLRASVADARGALDILSFDSPHSEVRFAIPAIHAVKKTDALSTVALEDVLRIPKSDRAKPQSFSVFSADFAVTIDAVAKPTPERALRTCPTQEEELVEIVDVGERQLVLVRPEVLHARLRSD